MPRYLIESDSPPIEHDGERYGPGDELVIPVTSADHLRDRKGVELHQIEDEADDEPEPAEPDDLTRLDGIGSERADDLNERGYRTFEDIRASDNDALAEIGGITAEKATGLIVEANDLVTGGAEG
ncbi:helix-hairpin-helix domain-containing protein [Halococcus saccharolyticus]|uniref:Helix-hairpin-helix domain-containing protein n=1 Tax=Halococcus saccharolyticus DSM 5350 TaxID=1227455 RepID=M0MQX4_9EURY|nr:helix-hairpin-helix domain-containing protein [Halococcus saccharolyticus]EMA48001.1 hypothetical protein C449_00975 [Halococcus saccharolyticus DSM 5350]